MTGPDGGWMKEWRVRNFYSQQQIADELHVRRQTVIAWEKSPVLDRVIYLSLRALEALPTERKIGARPNAIGSSSGSQRTLD